MIDSNPVNEQVLYDKIHGNGNHFSVLYQRHLSILRGVLRRFSRDLYWHLLWILLKLLGKLTPLSYLRFSLLQDALKGGDTQRGFPML